MTLRSKCELTAALLAIASIGIIAGSYLAAKRDAAKLRATLAAQNTVIADAGKRETARAAALQVSIGQVETLKKTTTTAPAIVRELPAILPLPVAIALRTPAPGAPADAPPDAIIPAADLKPLFDFAANCKECQEKLAAAAADKIDDADKIQALTKERDAAVTAFKGGSKWTRIKKAAKYVAGGAAAGALLVGVAVLAAKH